MHHRWPARLHGLLLNDGRAQVVVEHQDHADFQSTAIDGLAPLVQQQLRERARPSLLDLDDRWLSDLSRVGMGDAGVGGGWVEAGLVGVAGAGGFGEGVVDFEDGALGAVVAVGGEVFAFDDGEGVEDVGGVVAGDAVEVEEGGVEFAAEQEPPRLVPAERRPGVPAVARSWLRRLGSVRDSGPGRR